MTQMPDMQMAVYLMPLWIGILSIVYQMKKSYKLKQLAKIR